MKAFADLCMSEYDLEGWQVDDLRTDRLREGSH
jgi:hypothetical protein